MSDSSQTRPDTGAQGNIQIVLVEPFHGGNVGAVARAMKTMGLRRLVLVAPRTPIDETAIAMASRADDILHGARVVDSLAEALADSRYVYGMTARARRVGVPERPLREAAPQMLRDAAAGEVSVVFGRERTGLTNAELDLCHSRVFIPANPTFGSLNLAAAVQVVAYELAEQGPLPGRPTEVMPPARHEEVEAYYQHLERVLTELGFLGKTNPEVVMRRLRGLYQRAAPDEKEIQILRGILSATEKRRP